MARSNGSTKRSRATIKSEVLRRFQPDDPERAREALAAFAEHYNRVRLHSAIGYITPADILAGRQKNIRSERDQKLERARESRRQRRRRAKGDIDQPSVA
ncbi:MAG: integrase core domain-containing protein [Acidobacteriota bacterium]